jgi:hypothetical protein
MDSARSKCKPVVPLPSSETVWISSSTPHGR